MRTTAPQRMHLVHELSGLTIKRSKTGYILGHGASVMLVEADNGNVSETTRYNQHVWKGMVFMGQETSYVGPLLFEQLYKAVLPFTVGQTLPSGGLLTPNLATEMYDNPYLQQHPPETSEQDPSQGEDPIVEVRPGNKKVRKRAASTAADGSRKKPRASSPAFSCTPGQIKKLKANAANRVDKEIFVRGFMGCDMKKLTETSALVEHSPDTTIDPRGVIEDNSTGGFTISSDEYSDIEKQIRLEDDRRVYEEGIDEFMYNSVVLEFV